MAKEDTYLSEIIIKILKAPKSQQIFSTLVSEIIKIWVGENRLKKLISKPVEKSLLKSLDNIEKQRIIKGEIPSLLQNPEFLLILSEKIPEIFNTIFEILDTSVQNISKLPVSTKERIISEAFADISWVKIGDLTTHLVCLINNIHENHKTFFSDFLTPAFGKWYASADFGEIKDLFDGSKEDISNLITNINDELWKYPAKILIIFSLIPGILNIFILALKDQILRLNQLSPDLFCDIVLSLFKEIDAKNIGHLVNGLNEVFRKLNTGSALLGESGNPAFPPELAKFFNEVIGAVDFEILEKGSNALIQGKMTLEKEWTEALKKNPELILQKISQKGMIHNSKIRNMNQKADLYEILSDEQLSDAFDKAGSDLEVTEFAEALNKLFRTANRVKRKKPEFFSSMLTQFVNAIDVDEAKETLGWFVKDAVKVLKPLAEEIRPDFSNKEDLS